MALLDFSEIPPHTKTERGGWPLEVFALRFLEALGYLCKSGPTHGTGGGQDGIGENNATNEEGDTTPVRCLVRCKHNAHAKQWKGRSVGESDDRNIVNRVLQHGCGGVGFYSTEMTAGFESRLRGLQHRDSIKVKWCTPSQIELNFLNNGSTYPASTKR